LERYKDPRVWRFGIAELRERVVGVGVEVIDACRRVCWQSFRLLR